MMQLNNRVFLVVASSIAFCSLSVSAEEADVEEGANEERSPQPAVEPGADVSDTAAAEGERAQPESESPNGDVELLDPGEQRSAEEGSSDATPSEAPSAPEEAQSTPLSPDERRLPLRSALREVRPRLVACFADESAARETVLYLRARGGELGLARVSSSSSDPDTARCIRRRLEEIRLQDTAAPVVYLRFGLFESEERPEPDARLAESFLTYRRRYRAGVGLSIAGPLVTLVPGLTLFMLSWGAGPELGAGSALMALGAVAFFVGIPLVVTSLQHARHLVGVRERLRMSELHRLIEGDEEDHQQLNVVQEGEPRPWDRARSRRLELGGWITCGIGLAAVTIGLVLAGWIETEGFSVAAVSSSLVLIGLPMGIVGTVRRRRAERARSSER